MATPVSHFQQQPQQQQQPQPQPHIQHVVSTVAVQTCCGPFPKILPAKRRTLAYAIGITILLVGMISIIIGIVGIFTATVYIYGYYSGSSWHYVHRFNPTAWIGANIWCGVFVSYDDK